MSEPQRVTIPVDTLSELVAVWTLARLAEQELPLGSLRKQLGARLEALQVLYVRDTRDEP